MLTKQVSNLSPSQRMAQAMYNEVAHHWAIGDSQSTCATETEWSASYIAFVYSNEEAVYQRLFDTRVTTDAWDVQ